MKLPSDHEAKLLAAAQRVAGMDRTQGQEDRSILTLIAALECGLSSNDDGAAYDALAMLLNIQSVIQHYRLLNCLSLKSLLAALDGGGTVSVSMIRMYKTEPVPEDN